jgi:hypothetical protein
MSAKPLNDGGSTSPPFLTMTCAEISGMSSSSITMTRNPFLRVFSTGLGTVTLRGAAGGGGVSCGTGDWERPTTANDINSESKTETLIIEVENFIAALPLLQHLWSV